MASLPPNQQLPPTSQGLSGGDTPGANPLTLGGVQFNSIEVPDEAPIGALEQKLVTIELIGGGRQVQQFGAQPKPVTWKGVFWGSTSYIEGRVQQLRSYMISQQPQTLTYLTESWTCVIKDFTPTWKGGRCEYSIELEIITGAALTSSSFPTVNAQVDGNNAQTQALLEQISAQVTAEAFAPINILWQAYLVALGLLYEAEQIFQ